MMAADAATSAADSVANGQLQEALNGNGAQPSDTNGTTTTVPGLSADEIALYDRQIRLWGAQAQERIRSANILLVSLRALGTEIAKNLTLAGISSLTIIDDSEVVEEDLGAQYFVREEDVGKQRAEAAIPRIQELNPRVRVTSGGSVNDLLLRDQTYYAPFDCVIACDHDFMTLSMINTAARFANRPFYAAGIHGFYGYIFADLVGHEFVIEREKSNKPTPIAPESLTRSVLSVTTKKENNGKNTEIVKKQEIYCPLILANTSPLPPDILSNRRKLKSVPALLPCLRALFDFQRMNSRLPGHTGPDLISFTTLATNKARELQLPNDHLKAEFLRSFIQNLGAEIMPTAAFVGGRLSEDVINVLGKREQPIQNFALFDGDGLEGRIYSLYSPPPELQLAMVGNGMMPMDGTPMGMMTDPSMMGNGLNGDMGANVAGNVNGGMDGNMNGSMGGDMSSGMAGDFSAGMGGNQGGGIDGNSGSGTMQSGQTNDGSSSGMEVNTSGNTGGNSGGGNPSGDATSGSGHDDPSYNTGHASAGDRLIGPGSDKAPSNTTASSEGINATSGPGDDYKNRENDSGQGGSGGGQDVAL